jgi:hypothetical protein
MARKEVREAVYQRSLLLPTHQSRAAFCCPLICLDSHCGYPVCGISVLMYHFTGVRRCMENYHVRCTSSRPVAYNHVDRERVT